MMRIPLLEIILYIAAATEGKEECFSLEVKEHDHGCLKDLPQEIKDAYKSCSENSTDIDISQLESCPLPKGEMKFAEDWLNECKDYFLKWEAVNLCANKQLGVWVGDANTGSYNFEKFEEIFGNWKTDEKTKKAMTNALKECRAAHKDKSGREQHCPEIKEIATHVVQKMINFKKTKV